MPKHRRPLEGPGFSQKHPRETLTHSWWTAFAKPEQRADFIDAAKRRTRERTEMFRPVYGDAPITR